MAETTNGTVDDGPWLRLRPPVPADEAAILHADEQMRAEGFVVALGHQPGMAWTDYLDVLAAHRRGEQLPDGWVPTTFLVALVDGVIVGRTSIRHELNEFLLREGGHIGYGVFPEHRRRGHATEILRQSLIVARSHGVDRVLVTCDDDNVASATVIERCGGILESTVPTAERPPKRRYWIS